MRLVFQGQNEEYLEIKFVKNNSDDNFKNFINHRQNSFYLLWFEEDNNIITIDHVKHHFSKNQILFITEFNKVDISQLHPTRCLSFNRNFYCIIDHDSEVGCKGLLFFGAAQLPIINVKNDDLEVLSTVWKMFELEMKSKDELQLEMLQMMLKRLLILCTRLFKQQSFGEHKNNNHTNLIRDFNYLVEKHFKSLHAVSDYAKLLNRTPKTLSNLFSTMTNKTPLDYIHDRIMLEARRMLIYTDITIKEISYLLGFEDIQSFSRFFKNKESISPRKFRETYFKE